MYAYELSLAVVKALPSAITATASTVSGGTQAHRRPAALPSGNSASRVDVPAAPMADPQEDIHCAVSAAGRVSW